MNRLPLRVLAALIVASAASCAVPQPPTGGPRDDTPPELTSSEPADGTVQVRPSAIRLTFSEYVDRASLEQAVSVLPPFQERPTFDWSGRSVEVEFPDTLRSNTTYVLELNTTLQDVHGVALDQPIRVAFSTGPTIYSHRLAGRVIGAGRGRGRPQYAVIAHPIAPSGRAPDLETPGPYRTQTGDGGRFELSHLPDSTFFVLALRDRNQNRRPDPGEAYAPPPYTPVRSSEAEGGDEALRFIVTRTDTVAPRVRGVESRSRQTSVLRFSEPVDLLRLDGPPMVGAAQPSTEAAPSFFEREETPTRVFVRTPPLSEGRYRLPLDGLVADTSGNVLSDTTVSVNVSTRADTSTLRLVDLRPAPDAQPAPWTRRPALRFSRPVDTSRLADQTAVLDSAGGVIQGRWTTTDGTRYRFEPTRSAALAGRIVLRLDDGFPGRDTERTDTLTYLPNSIYGRLSGRIDSAEAGPVRLRIRSSTGENEPGVGSFDTRVSTDSTGAFAFERVPEGTYRLRYFRDLVPDATWNGGTLRPYQPPEPVGWTDSVRVRARWDTELEGIRLDPTSLTD